MPNNVNSWRRCYLDSLPKKETREIGFLDGSIMVISYYHILSMILKVQGIDSYENTSRFLQEYYPKIFNVLADVKYAIYDLGVNGCEFVEDMYHLVFSNNNEIRTLLASIF